MNKHLLTLSLVCACLWLACNLDKVDDICANPPNAEFTPDKTSGNAPLTVSFDNNSTGSVASYLWAFNAGQTSSLPEPTHTFSSPGTFSVSLVVTSSTGCKDTATVEIIVNPAGPVPVATFTLTNGGCIAPCDVIFSNTSTDATSFEWDFGDGTPIVTQANPTHKYELPGGFIVTLTAMGAGGTDMETKTVLVKTQTFKKTFGGDNIDSGYSVQQTSDGGYVLLGYTASEGAGNNDFYLIKTDNAGTLVWKKTFGGLNNDEGYSVQQTFDGGYVLFGYTESEGAGTYDFYLIKTNNIGTLVWKKTYGGLSYDEGYSVQQTSDGGFVLLGYTTNEGAGQGDFYLIKTDNIGNIVWKNTFGGGSNDVGYSVRQTSDGGYILLGETRSLGAGISDFYLVKTDDVGQQVWEKTFGGASVDYGNSVQQTSDGGYILLGETQSEGAGGGDFYLVKTDNIGNLVWKQTFGGDSDDVGYSVQQTSDGGYILLGETRSLGAGGLDFYLIKTDDMGNQVWQKTFGGTSTDEARSVQQTFDGGYILLGRTYSAGAGDLYLIKTDKDGNAQ